VNERKPVGLLVARERLAWDVCALKVVIPSGRVVGWEEKPRDVGGEWAGVLLTSIVRG
jgi:hypothetical protein